VLKYKEKQNNNCIVGIVPKSNKKISYEKAKLIPLTDKYMKIYFSGLAQAHYKVAELI